ncbi:MAG: family 43 glycosylhydrolase [Bacteroidales bacterium]|nr:family 43 glycosylhydrolase [Bacteroidales bacterium]
MKKIVLAVLMLLPMLAEAIGLKDIRVRDPFILADGKTQTYYLYCSSSVSHEGKTLGGVAVYWSKDLADWQGPKQVFEVPESNWATGLVWAPEVHQYRGKYYLFATMNSSVEWKRRDTVLPPYYLRGTQIFRADSPEGPFLPLGDKPATPEGEMCLDGTLWVEDGVPYMVYCHEWVETLDGEMRLMRLTKNLHKAAGPSSRLFCASAASWASPLQWEGMGAEKYYVTDGPFLYRTRTGKLVMLWSSFVGSSYAVGIAESTTGRIAGPWIHQREPLFSRDGGHGMLFRSFDGRLYVVLHSPNAPSGAERAVLHEVEDVGETLRLRQ